jgi:hypothetical protein
MQLEFDAMRPQPAPAYADKLIRLAEHHEMPLDDLVREWVFHNIGQIAKLYRSDDLTDQPFFAYAHSHCERWFCATLDHMNRHLLPRERRLFDHNGVRYSADAELSVLIGAYAAEHGLIARNDEPLGATNPFLNLKPKEGQHGQE